jgi:hypothetical protein
VVKGEGAIVSKIAVIASVGIFLIFMGGCSDGNKSEKSTEVTQPTQSNSPPSPSTSNPQAFKTAIQPEQPGDDLEVYGLIPSTSPLQRREMIAQGRQDPFELIAVQPIVKVKPLSPKSFTSSTSGTSTSGTSSRASQSSAPIHSPPTQPQQIVPRPELARAVTITGLIDVGGVTQIIVKAPNEGFSRYVQPGQYLSNGQVLVKRIEMNQGSTPIVVLEELGIEVYKEIGART